MEFKSALDVQIAEKMLKFPLLGERIEEAWNLSLTREFDMTNDSHLYKTESTPGRLPLWEGKQFHQFEPNFAKPRYWLDEPVARAELLSPRIKAVRREMVKLGLPGEPDANAIRLNYDSYRLAFRDVAASTNERTVIATVLPPKRFCPHTVSLEQVYFDSVSKLAGYVSGQYLDHSQCLYVTALFNSYVFDWFTR